MTAVNEDRLAGLIMLSAAHHSDYVAIGAETDRPDDLEISLGSQIVVVDRDGWCTLHEITGIYRRPAGRRTIRFGERLLWPDGTISARALSAYLPDADAERRQLLQERAQ